MSAADVQCTQNAEYLFDLLVLLLPFGCHVGSYPGRAAYLSRSAPTIPKIFGFVDKIFEFFDLFGTFQHFSGFF